MSLSSDALEVLLQVAAKQGSGVATNMTKKVHRTAYTAISPTRPELSQEGKTVLITGGGTNIGLNIAKAFVQAGAKTIIIIGRRAEVLSSAKREILAETQAGTKKVEVILKSVDVKDKAAIQELWAGLKHDGVKVDVLVSNAVQPGESQSLLGMGADAVWERMQTNMYGPLLMAEMFSKQGGDGHKSIINVSTAAAHTFQREENVLAATMPSYNLSKASGTLAMQLIANDADPSKLTVISFHPGMLHNEYWDAAGVSKTQLPFDDFSLPAGVAVWLASPEAAFLHGRLIWASWDVDELKKGELRKRIEEDITFLKFGLNGVRNGHRAW